MSQLMIKRLIAIITVIALLSVFGYGCNSDLENPDIEEDANVRPLIVLERPVDEDTYSDFEYLPEDFDEYPGDVIENSEDLDIWIDDDLFDEDIEEIEKEEEADEVFVLSIYEVDAELFESLNGTASRLNAVAVSLAAFDGANSFLTFQYGHAGIIDNRFIDVETKFRVASLSKIATAIVAMILVDDGIIGLDVDISEYFGTTVRNPSHPDVPITPRMLMQHTSTIIDSNAFLSSRATLGRGENSTLNLLGMGSTFSSRIPGASYSYTNFGFSVLAAICELATSTSFDLLARELLFKPLGIYAAYMPSNLIDTGNIAGIYNASHRLSRSVYTQINVGTSGVLGHDHHLAQGNLTISALDYARILAMLANNGVLGNTRILSEEAVREIHYANVSGGAFMQGLAVRFQESGFMSENIFWHTGSNYGEFAQFVYCPILDRGVVVLTTGMGGERLSNGMLRGCTLLAELVWTFLNDDYDDE